jgi:hypothetical protein
MKDEDGIEEATHAREIRDPELGNEDKKVDPDRSSSNTEEKHREQVIENVKA